MTKVVFPVKVRPVATEIDVLRTVVHKVRAACYNLSLDPMETVEQVRKAVHEAEDHECAQRSTVETLLHELARTRWKRMRDTQFVYWSHRHHPRYEQANGSITWAQEHSHVREILNSLDLYEEVCRIESELFNAYGNEATVFWRGWTVMADPLGRYTTVACSYCVIYTYDGGCHSEPKALQSVLITDIRPMNNFIAGEENA